MTAGRPSCEAGFRGIPGLGLRTEWGIEPPDPWVHAAFISWASYAQMKMNALRGEANTDFLNIAADRYTRAKQVIRGLLPALVCYNVCCLAE